MNLDELITTICNKFPQLPKPQLWEKYDLKRLYFNKKEGDNNYTFYIGILEGNVLILRLNREAKWYENYPSKQTITEFLVTLKDRREKQIFTIEEGVTSEFYEINLEKFKKLFCYEITVDGEINKIGGKLAYRLQKEFKNFWNFTDYTLVSDELINEKEIKDFISKLWVIDPDTFKDLHDVSFLPNKEPSASSIAKFAVKYIINRFGKKIKALLNKYTLKIGKVGIKRDITITGWNILNKSSLSLSIKSHLYYEDTMDKFLNSLSLSHEKILGFSLQVIDLEFNHKGVVKKITGPMKDHRDRLLKLSTRENIKRLISKAPDDELVLKIDGQYDYPSSTLYPIVNTRYAHLFNVKMSNLMNKLTLSPKFRVKVENEVLSILGDFLINNFNSKSFPALFKSGKDIGFDGMLKYGDKTNHYVDSYVLKELKEHGVYEISERFQDKKHMKIALLLGVVNYNYSSFWNAIKDKLKSLEFKTELVMVMNLTKIDRITVEEKANLIMKEGCDVVLAILPNKNQDLVYEIVKYGLLHGDIIASQFIFKETIESNLKYALANIILGILAKTENIPYILATPLEFADYFVGIDISREKKESLIGSVNYAAVARFYGKDGTFVSYDIQKDKIEGETVPQIVLERIFAKKQFKGKVIMIHRDGLFRGDEINNLKEIGKNHNIKFKFVEVIKRNVPRIFKVSNGHYFNPERDQIFYLNKREAVVINNKVTGNKTAKPLRIRVRDNKTSLDNAILSVMALRMMHFGTTKTPKLPVTISFSDRISGFVRRGITPPYESGTIPWWY